MIYIILFMVYSWTTGFNGCINLPNSKIEY